MATVCYPDAAHSPRTGSLVELAGNLAVLGQADVLRNAYLDQDANAALALRLLGTGARLTWLVPDPLQAPDVGPSSLTEALPPAVRWVTLQLGVAVVLALAVAGPAARPPGARAAAGRGPLGRDAAGPRPAVPACAGPWPGGRHAAHRLAAPSRGAPGSAAGGRSRRGRRPRSRGRRHRRGRRPAPAPGPPPADDRALVALADALDDLEHALATSTREAHR